MRSVVAIKKRGTGTHTTEIHVLNDNDPKTFTLQIPTALHEVGGNFEFAIADWNHDGQPDLIAIKKNGTGTGTTEVHVLDGHTLNAFLVYSGTALHETGDDFAFAVADWNGDGHPDIIAIKK